MTSRARSAGGHRRPSPAEFREVIGHFATGVTVVTTKHQGESFGTTASALASLSLDPPMMLICMNKSSVTGRAIAASRLFAINVLAQHQGDLAQHFASKHPAKLQAVPHALGLVEQPLLSDAVANLECRVTDEVSGGTHTVFLAEVESATARGGAPLAHFRGRFARLEATTDHPTGESTIPAITSEQVKDVLDSRCAIELGVVDVTVGHADGQALADLRRAATAWGSEDAGWTYTQRHGSTAQPTAFHDVLVGLCRQSGLLRAYRSLAPPAVMQLIREAHVAGPDVEHRRLLEAYERADAARAREIVIHHNWRLKQAASHALDLAHAVRSSS